MVVFLRTTLLGLLLIFSSAVTGLEMNQQIFDRIVTAAERLYHREFHRHDQRLNISARWEAQGVYANAWKMEDANGEKGLIMISGGLARHPDMTPDAFALVLCHEIGHHIAGPPHLWRFSAEGQSDYFGASSCLRKLFVRMGETLPASRRHAPKRVREACALAFSHQQGRQGCQRIALAGATLARYFARKRGQLSPLFSRPAQSSVSSTLLTPATPQCRLDTYFAAAQCNVARQPLNHPEPRWLCLAGDFPRAARPACWYKARVESP